MANELTKRVISLFELDEANSRKSNGDQNWFYQLPENKDLVLFYEYFHGDTGRGLGASHQTGWTAVIAQLINETAEKEVRTEKHIHKSYDEED